MPKREYNNDYPSVTQVLNVLRKIALEAWFKKNTPEFIQQESKRGKDIGTQIHECIHNYIQTGESKIETEFAEEVTNALKSFMLFRKEHPEIELKNAEVPLTSEIHRYNGTIDCIGNDIIVDWKTGNAKEEEKPAIYPEYLYQVSAYVFLWNETQKENIKQAVIVAIAKDKVAYNLEYMDLKKLEECFYEVFVPALRICNYQRRKK